jgi:hypothetical protein
MSRFVMRVVGMAGSYYNESEMKDVPYPDPCYVEDYDLDYMEGRGQVKFTADPNQARSWNTAVQAFEAWRTVSPTMPLRPDGRPNRPLTALNITPEEVA